MVHRRHSACRRDAEAPATGSRPAPKPARRVPAHSSRSPAPMRRIAGAEPPAARRRTPGCAGAQVGVAHEAVLVERDVVEQRDSRPAGWRACRSAAATVIAVLLSPSLKSAARASPCGRAAVASVSRTVDGPSTGHTRYGAGAEAPAAERLAEVLVLALDAQLGGDVEHAADAEEGVGGERASSSRKPGSTLPCRKWLIADQASPTLPKKLPTPVRTSCGTTSL